jgi:peptidoglycan/xylan/chitin deacetylase (PgdA/CDA1 family)
MKELFLSNSADAFWRPVQSLPQPLWERAILRARDCLPAALNNGHGPAAEEVIPAVLSESLFGPARYRLSKLKSVYYTVARPLLPAWVRPLLRKVWVRPPSAEREPLLKWPVEERYVQFQWKVIANAMEEAGRNPLDIVGLWPNGNRFSFVLTHDVEARKGHDFVREVMALEEQYGFRSSFNFVPEGYKVDQALLEEMAARGFEVGVHGLKHDGRLFSSRERFAERSKKINGYLSQWGAVGYRSPMTHRHPEWMQALDIEYDLSFFDTDPYEPMAGGTMSIWPFFIGRFVELPYTLMQDHTYLEVLQQRSPQLWLEKVEFLQAHYGMVLLNSHPDYLLKPGHLPVYESFLAAMQKYQQCWHALPRDVARWWRRRAGKATHSITDKEKSQPMALPSTWHLVKSINGQIQVNVNKK